MNPSMPWLPGQHYKRGLLSGRLPVRVSTLEPVDLVPPPVEVGKAELHNTTVIESQPPQQD